MYYSEIDFGAHRIVVVELYTHCGTLVLPGSVLWIMIIAVVAVRVRGNKLELQLLEPFVIRSVFRCFAFVVHRSAVWLFEWNRLDLVTPCSFVREKAPI